LELELGVRARSWSRRMEIEIRFGARKMRQETEMGLELGEGASRWS